MRHAGQRQFGDLAASGQIYDHGLGAIARGTGIRIDEIREERGRLDEVFRNITTGTKA